MRANFPCIVCLTCVFPVMLLASCRVSEPTAPRRTQRTLYQWHDDGGEGQVTVRISLPDQIAEFERGGRYIGWCYVATGKEGHDTHPGTYKIMEKIVDKHSNRYGWIEDEFGNVVNGDATPRTPVQEGTVYVPAPMPYWMRITAYGIGMHGGLIPEPGKPASHGCIRMPKEFVPTLFDAVDVGTPVTITNEASDRGGSLEDSPVPAARPEPWDQGSRVIATRPLSPGEAAAYLNHSPRRATESFTVY